jgi:hypothetical protein
LVNLFNDIELFAAVFFVKNPFAKHEYTHFIALVYGYIGKPYGIVDGFTVIRRDNEQDLLHRYLQLFTGSDFLLPYPSVAKSFGTYHRP